MSAYKIDDAMVERAVADYEWRCRTRLPSGNVRAMLEAALSVSCNHVWTDLSGWGFGNRCRDGRDKMVLCKLCGEEKTIPHNRRVGPRDRRVGTIFLSEARRKASAGRREGDVWAPQPTSKSDRLQREAQAAEGEWEVFCDTSYFDMWCVRPRGSRVWGDGFHLSAEKEARALKTLLESRRRQEIHLHSRTNDPPYSAGVHMHRRAMAKLDPARKPKAPGPRSTEIVSTTHHFHRRNEDEPEAGYHYSVRAHRRRDDPR